jgi:hypothetical protein
MDHNIIIAFSGIGNGRGQSGLGWEKAAGSCEHGNDASGTNFASGVSQVIHMFIILLGSLFQIRSQTVSFFLSKP